MATKRPKPVPEISQDYLALQAQNPLYNIDDPDPRVNEDLTPIFYDRNGEVREHNDIVKRIKIYQVAIKWRVLQMLNNQDWANKRGNTEEIFKRSHRTFLKTTQEILSADTDRIPFYRSDIANPAKLQAAFDAIIIDPSRINDKLLENLGLTQHLPQKGKLQEEQTECRAQAIPEIRDMFQSLEPVQGPVIGISYNNLRYFRMMKVSKGVNEGYILGTQHIDNRKKIFKTDLFGAERRLLNIEASYEDEIRKLTWIKIQLEDVEENLAYWNEIKNTQKFKDLQVILIECTETLKHVKNKNKQDLKNKIRECISFKDSTGKHNPTIIRSKLKKAIRYIDSRFKGISNIHGYIGKDKAYTTSLLESEKLPMSNLINDIEKDKDDLLIIKSPVKISQPNRDRITANLKGVLYSVRNIRFQPNLAFCNKLKVQIYKVIGHLENKQDEEAKVEFIKAYLIIKIKRAQHQLNEIHKSITVNKKIYNPEVLKSQLKSTYNLLRNHEIAPSIEIKAYLDEYIKVYQVFDELREKVDELLDPKKTLGTEDAPNRNIPFEELLDSFTERFPLIKSVLGGMKRRVAAYVEKTFDITIKKASSKSRQAKPTYTVADKNKTYADIAKTIKELDFVELIRNIKD